MGSALRALGGFLLRFALQPSTPSSDVSRTRPSSEAVAPRKDEFGKFGEAGASRKTPEKGPGVDFGYRVILPKGMLKFKASLGPAA